MGRDARGRSRVFRNPAQASWRPGTRGGTGGAAGAAPCGAEAARRLRPLGSSARGFDRIRGKARRQTRRGAAVGGGSMRGMDAVIAMQADGRGHVVMHVLPMGDEEEPRAAVGIEEFNRLVLSKNLTQLMSCIDELGPISLVPLCPNPPALFAVEQERVLRAGEAARLFRRGALLQPDARLLEGELLIDHPAVARVNVSALRRAARERDAAGAGFLGRLEAAGEDARVSVEPLRDWLGLRNGLAAASRVLGFMTNPPLADGLDPRALRAAPLAAAGFERAGGQYRLPSSPSLSVACGEGDVQAEVARRYIEAEFDAWLRPTVGLGGGLGLEVSPTSVGTGLVTGLWRMLALRDGWEVAICPNCGSAFLRPSKGYAARRRQWCDNSCRLLYVKRGGPGAWFDSFKARCGGR